MEDDNRKHCGNCCWFYCEQTGGEGFCIQQINEFDDGMMCYDVCQDMGHGQPFISRLQMRHHMAVLLQANRFYKNPEIYRIPPADDFKAAVEFAYKYMKAFREL